MSVSAIGLFYDIAGVIVLGWALASAPDKMVKGLASTGWGYGRHTLRNLIDQRLDARFGLLLLVIGFLLQLDGTLRLALPKWAEWIAGLGLFVIGIGYLIIRRRLADRKFQQLESELQRQT